jgi:hypothetical protein
MNEMSKMLTKHCEAVKDAPRFYYIVSIFSMCIYSGRYGPDLQELLCPCLRVPYEPVQFWIISVSRAVR